jgi:hypothetical protein
MRNFSVIEFTIFVALSARIHPAVAQWNGQATLLVGQGLHTGGPRRCDVHSSLLTKEKNMSHQKLAVKHTETNQSPPPLEIVEQPQTLSQAFFGRVSEPLGHLGARAVDELMKSLEKTSRRARLKDDLEFFGMMACLVLVYLFALCLVCIGIWRLIS